MSKIRIIIADDHKLFRDGIIALISKTESMEIVGDVESGEELLSLLEGELPHVVLIDISMSGISGLDVIEKCRRIYPSVRFIALTMHAEGQYVVKAVKNGAYGYLLKNADEEELLAAIEDVASGKKYFNDEISRLMIGNMSLEGDEDKKLSDREMEVLELVSQGKTTKEIAAELYVSTRTVETHRVNMMKKLNVQNVAELIKKAAHLKLI
jgi:two-component system response regulator NreC